MFGIPEYPIDVINQNAKTDQLLSQTKGIDKELSGDDITKHNEKIKQSAQKFESYMVSLMIKEMRKSVPKSGFISGGQAEEIFQDMQDNSLAEAFSKRGLGLGEAIYRQMKLKTDNSAS